jgi:hypothetical protein
MEITSELGIEYKEDELDLDHDTLMATVTQRAKAAGKTDAEITASLNAE